MAKFYLNATRLRENGACMAAVERMASIFGPGNWPVTDKMYAKLKDAGEAFRIVWVAHRYLPAKQRQKVFSGDYDYDNIWKAVKAQMVKDTKPRPAAWRRKSTDNYVRRLHEKGFQGY